MVTKRQTTQFNDPIPPNTHGITWVIPKHDIDFSKNSDPSDLMKSQPRGGTGGARHAACTASLESATTGCTMLTISGASDHFNIFQPIHLGNGLYMAYENPGVE